MDESPASRSRGIASSSLVSSSAEAESFAEAENGSKNGDQACSQQWRVWIPAQADQGTLESVGAHRRVVKLSPLASMKAIKNADEAKHMRAAHVEDAVALCEYLLWLEEKVGGKTEINEWDAAQKVDGLRAQQPTFISLSFETISSIGANGAVIHYKPERDTAKTLTRDEVKGGVIDVMVLSFLPLRFQVTRQKCVHECYSDF